jgi:hypothetical protein
MTLHRQLIAAAAIALSAFATAGHAALVFDNFPAVPVSGTNIGSTGSTPNTFMGSGFTLAAGTSQITGFDLFPVNLSGTTFNALLLNIYVWGTVNTSGTVNAATPAFSNLLGSYSFTTTGSYATGFYYSFVSATPGVTPGVALTTPLAVSGPNVGITLNYQGSTDGGASWLSANSLTSMISYGAAPSVGANLFNGYYRNANSETNGNFTSTLRSLGLTNQSVAVRIYGDVSPVPEPGTYALMAMGLAALLVVRRKARQG